MKALLAAALLVSFSASAAELNCSIKASKEQAKGDLTTMAKIATDAAKKTALNDVKASDATIANGGLEVQNGCLVYSYDVKVPGKSGTQEVLVDAGNGKVLKSYHESAVKESAETVAEKTKNLGHKAKKKVTPEK